MPFNTPIAFFIFNRPELTRRVFQAISDCQPRKLLIIGDGPRKSVDGEQEKVAESRRILEQIDWHCDVETNLSSVNLGCRNRMASGLDWAFERSEELIILEDDCLPSPSFFGFCQQLLERYRDDKRIMMISGDNFQPQPRSSASYYFSRWPHIWGWASWRRAWGNFDISMSSWPEVKARKQLMSVFRSDSEYDHWEKTLDLQHAGEIDTWDFSWAYACWVNSGLTILPETNLVSNLGFGPSATHTIDSRSPLANLKRGNLTELIHPLCIAPDYLADQFTWNNIFAPPQPRANVAPKWFRRFSRRNAA